MDFFLLCIFYINSFLLLVFFFLHLFLLYFFFFFFQAEDGIRDFHVTGVQTCALPILALVATAAMAGVPLLNGFLSKEMFFAETLGHGDNLFEQALPYLATLAS